MGSMMGGRGGWLLSLAFVILDWMLINPTSLFDDQLFQALALSPLFEHASVAYQIVAKEDVDYAEDWATCRPGNFTNSNGKNMQHRNALIEELVDATDFSTKLDLGNVKMLVLGDSVGMQVFHMLDVASGGTKAGRTVVKSVYGNHISYGLSSTGNLGAMRMTGMLLRKNENKPIPNAPGGGWNRDLVRTLLNVPDATGTTPIGAFDVLLYRIPHGWLELEEITESTIRESLEIASALLGVKKVILMTLPFNNNVINGTTRVRWFEKNRELRDLATNFVPHLTFEGIESLVLLDIAQLTNEFIQTNARHLDYLDGVDSHDMHYLDMRLKDFREWQVLIRPAAAHVCSGPLFEKPYPIIKTTKVLCEKNSITYDGMHLCGNTYGGRIVAATGCLTQCVYGSAGNMLACQQDCNDKFMTLKPVGVGSFQHNGARAILG